MAFTSDSKNLGYFVEKDYGHEYTYRLTENPWALHKGFTHEIDVADQTRFATVKQTVCIVCLDEGESGVVITEKWQIKKHVHYPT